MVQSGGIQEGQETVYTCYSFFACLLFFSSNLLFDGVLHPLNMIYMRRQFLTSCSVVSVFFNQNLIAQRLNGIYIYSVSIFQDRQY